MGKQAFARRRDWRSELLVRLPSNPIKPLMQLLHRALMALGILALSTLIVWFDRGSYSDNTGQDGVSLIDALYYSTVTITTTGYGDITPLTPSARLISAIVITPLRIIFLVLLVGTTLQVLADQGRRSMLDATWRKRMRNHTVVIGYGTKGRSAVHTLVKHEVPPDKIVIIDPSAEAVADANIDGLAAFEGDGSRRTVLRRAEVSKAREVIITLDRDDATILTTLTVRQLNPRAHIVASVREHENASLVRQSGADNVVTSSDAVGRLMGLGSVNPHIGEVMEDLLSRGEGLEVVQRQVTAQEAGATPSAITDERVLAVVRNGTLRNYHDPTCSKLQVGDELVVVRRSPGHDSHRPQYLPLDDAE